MRLGAPVNSYLYMCQLRGLSIKAHPEGIMACIYAMVEKKKLASCHDGGPLLGLLFHLEKQVPDRAAH